MVDISLSHLVMLHSIDLADRDDGNLSSNIYAGRSEFAAAAGTYGPTAYEAVGARSLRR